MEDEYPTSECRSCGAPIIWVITQNRKRMPMDAEPIVIERGRYKLAKRDDGSIDAYLVNRVWVSHFATCDAPERFRKR